MNLAILGGFNEAPPAGWTSETAIAVFGGGDLDLSLSPPAPGATLTAVAVFGGITIVVPPGSRVHLSGAGILGSRRVEVAGGGAGPELEIRAYAVFGSVDVKQTVGATSGAPA